MLDFSDKFPEWSVWADDTNQRRLRVREVLVDDSDKPAAVLFEVYSAVHRMYMRTTEIGFGTLRKMRLRRLR